MEERPNSSSAPGERQQQHLLHHQPLQQHHYHHPLQQQPGASSAPVRGPLQRSRAFYAGGDENEGDGMDTADGHSANFLQVRKYFAVREPEDSSDCFLYVLSVVERECLKVNVTEREATARRKVES